MVRIAINGFGRIAKNFLRGLIEDNNALKKIEVVAINIGPKAGIEASAHAFKYDTIMKKFDGTVEYANGYLKINELKIKIFAEADPEKIKWSDYKIDFVVDATGKFTDAVQAKRHIDSGAKKVIITAPAKGDDITIVMGVNQNLYKKSEHNIISLASCTTNALVVMLKAINEYCGIESGMMTTVHAYTNSQPLLDVDASKSDLRKGRAAAINIVPTGTGAMKLVDKMMPEIAGKIKGLALRVPVATVSLIDLSFISKKTISVEALHNYFLEKSKSDLKGFLDINNQELVSSDFSLNPHSAIIDAGMTIINGNFCKVFGWYDNEWGYSQRIKDILDDAIIIQLFLVLLNKVLILIINSGLSQFPVQ